MTRSQDEAPTVQEMAAPAPSSEPKSTPDPRVQAAVAGDRRALQALLLELLPRVRNLVRYLAYHDADVDDIAQLVLVQLLRALPGYRGEGALSSFADRITVRVAMTELRRRRSDRNKQRELAPDLWPVPSDPLAPDTYALRREVVSWLDELPPEQRQVVVLHHVVGLSVPELATELGIPFETARSRLRLGFQKLRALAGAIGGEP